MNNNKYLKLCRDYQNAVERISKSNMEFLKFLNTAAHNYRFDFRNAVTIYAQNPEATALLTYDQWTKVYGRVPRRYSKAIILFDSTDGRYTVTFDYGKTVPLESPPDNIKEIKFFNFSVTEETKEAIKSIYPDFANQDSIDKIFLCAVNKRIMNNESTAQSKLSDFYAQAVVNMLMNRLGAEAPYSNLLSHNAFDENELRDIYRVIINLFRAEFQTLARQLPNYVIVQESEAKKMFSTEKSIEIIKSNKIPSEETNYAVEAERRSSILTQEELDDIFKIGANTVDSKYRIYEYFTENHSTVDKFEFLAKEYGIGGHSYKTILNNDVFIGYESNGLRISSKNFSYDVNISYTELAYKIDHFIATDEYLTPDEAQKLQLKKARKIAPANIRPTITCEWSEHPDFKDGKTYSVSEFDQIMKSADDEWVRLRKYEQDIYGNDIKAIFQAYENSEIDGVHQGYAKTKFTLNMPDGTKYTERQDIGDGDGGVIDFLGQYPQYNEVVLALKEDIKNNFNVSEYPLSEELNLFDIAEQDEEVAVDIKNNSTEIVDTNFVITDNNIGIGTPLERYRNNISAIKLLNDINSEQRKATSEEQEILARYVGWGGLSDSFENEKRNAQLQSLLSADDYEAAKASTLTAFYTPPVVIKSVYNALSNMGFTNGNILDPACGTGHFFGLLPDHIRQGNTNDKVYIFNYVTKGTFDAFMYQTVERKQRFISTFMTSSHISDRSIEDIDETVLNYAQIKAVASGNPLVQRKFEIDTQVAKLTSLRNDFFNEHHSLEDEVQIHLPKRIITLEAAAEKYKEDIEFANEHQLSDDNFKIIIKDKVYTDKKEAVKALFTLENEVKPGELYNIGSFRGFKLYMYKDMIGGLLYDLCLTVKNVLGYRVKLSKYNGLGNITRISDTIDNSISQKLSDTLETIDECKQRLSSAEQEIKKEFPKEAEYQELLKEQADINAKLNVYDNPVYETTIKDKSNKLHLRR